MLKFREEYYHGPHDMEINCPSCIESVLLVDADIGKKIECPFCGNRFRVDGGNNFEKDLKAAEESRNNNYCSNCGNKLNLGVKFCSSCGTSIGEILTYTPTVSGAIHSGNHKKEHTLTGGNYSSSISWSSINRWEGWAILFGLYGLIRVAKLIFDHYQ